MVRASVVTIGCPTRAEDKGSNSKALVLTAMADVNSSNVSSSNVPASNPLSKKLNKILETRLDNDKVFFCFTVVSMFESVTKLKF